MSLIVFDMGRRVETPTRSTPLRVEAVSATAATKAVDSSVYLPDTQLHNTEPNNNPLLAARSAIEAYEEQTERHPAVVSFIKDILHRQVTTLSPNHTLEQAWNILQETGYKLLPIIDSNNYVLAMFSDGELLRALATQAPENIKEFWQSNVMTLAARPVLCVQEETDIHQTSRLLYEYNIGALPVLDNDNTLCGIVTRSDILRLLSHYGPLQLWA